MNHPNAYTGRERPNESNRNPHHKMCIWIFMFSKMSCVDSTVGEERGRAAGKDADGLLRNEVAQVVPGHTALYHTPYAIALLQSVS